MGRYKLSQRKVETAGPGKHEDGDGLRLVVSKAGSRKWVYRFMLDGRRREMGLGGYPAVGLAAARERADEARRLAARGIDPVDHRPQEQAPSPTFTTAAARYIRAHRRGWSNPKHARQWVSTLKTYARPALGSKRVDDISTADVLAVLSPVWHTTTETAKRVQGRMESILDFAAAHKWRDQANPARWRGHLDKLLPRPSRVKAVVHHPAMPYVELPVFVAELRANGSMSARALEFLIMTATRTGEVLGAEWREVDLEAGVWTVPADRMKARRDHRIPLSGRALDLLAGLPRVAGNRYLFPGARQGRPLSSTALLQLMRSMGYGPVVGSRGLYVPHGFRSSFRDWAGETSTFPGDVVEMAIAHAIQNKTEAAYRRGDLFDKRRALMEAWASWCAPPAGSTVVPLRRKGGAV